MSYLGLVGLSLAFGFGVFLIILSFALPKSTGVIIKESESGGLVRGFLGEGFIIQGMLADISSRIQPASENLEDDLRKSGYVYQSLAEYHARRMYGALIFSMFGIILGIAMNLGGFLIALLASMMALVGFTQADSGIKKGLEKRQKRIIIEMTYGLDRIALFLTSEATLSQALSSVSKLGLFGQICSRMSTDIGIKRPFEEIIARARADVPSTPELEEFFRLAQDSLRGKGFNLIDPLQSRANSLRDRLENAIVTEAGLAKVRVLLISAGFIMAASLLVTIGPTLFLLSKGGVF